MIDTSEENIIVGENDNIIKTKKEPKKTKDSNDCKEYQALKYKTMIATGTNLEKKIENETTEQDLDAFLNRKIIEKKTQHWNKLTKTEKIKRLKAFINNNFKKKHELNDDELIHARRYILNMLERKKLNKNVEVSYDEQRGEISDIPVIEFNESSRKFTLNKSFNGQSKKVRTPKSKTNTKKVKPVLVKKSTKRDKDKDKEKQNKN